MPRHPSFRGSAATCRFGAALLLAAWAQAGAGCGAQHYRIGMTPSLRPVDAARPMVVFSQIQGHACGRDAVLGAIRDMKRLEGVDGYLEVVVEETGEGDERCAKVTAYPFRYGESTDTPVVRAGEPSLDPQRVLGRPHGAHAGHCPMHGGGGHGHHGPDAGRDPEPAAAVDCEQACGDVAALVESETIKRALTKDRCLQRCRAGEPAFAACIAAASSSPAAAACLQSGASVAGGEPP